MHRQSRSQDAKGSLGLTPHKVSYTFFSHGGSLQTDTALLQDFLPQQCTKMQDFARKLQKFREGVGGCI